MEQKKLTAQIAAAYLGVFITDEYAEGARHQMVGASTWTQDIEVVTGDGTDWWNSHICKLILAPLYSMKVSDAVDLCVGILGEELPEGLDIDEANEKAKALGRRIQEHLHSGEAELTPRIIDFLRSRGYDCGYGDIPSLIESGIAIAAPNDERSVATDEK